MIYRRVATSWLIGILICLFVLAVQCPQGWEWIAQSQARADSPGPMDLPMLPARPIYPKSGNISPVPSQSPSAVLRVKDELQWQQPEALFSQLGELASPEASSRWAKDAVQLLRKLGPERCRGSRLMRPSRCGNWKSWPPKRCCCRRPRKIRPSSRGCRERNMPWPGGSTFGNACSKSRRWACRNRRCRSSTAGPCPPAWRRSTPC